MKKYLFILLPLLSCAREAEEAEDTAALSLRPIVQTGIAVLRPGETTCPQGQHGWVLSPPLAEPFARFCEYTYTRANAGLPAGAFGDLENPVLEAPADADVGRVYGQTATEESFDVAASQLRSEMSAAMSGTLGGLFRAHADIPPAPALLNPALRSRLAIVDTMPHGAPAPRSVHAPSLGAIARAIVCGPSGACAVDIQHYLAMPRVEAGQLDLTNGGHYGTLWELAKAISAAVAANTSGAPLVINLSLGWEPDPQINLPTDHLALILGSGQNIPAPERAVHAALVHARCSNALVFAAAGNKHVSFHGATGQMLPARWSSLRSPSDAECSSMFGDRAAHSANPSRGRPLLYAVGGVDRFDHFLENARPDSTPELTAPSSYAWAPGGLDILTGTSVATIVAAASASMVAAIRPDLGPDRTFDLVKNAGTPLSLCEGITCTSTRRISVCRAEAAACAGLQTCAALSCAAVGAPPPQWPFSMFVDAAADLLARSTFLMIDYAPAQSTNSCGNVAVPTGAPLPDGSCPYASTIAVQNLDLSPQPVDPMCPVCWTTQLSSGVVVLAINLSNSIPGDRIYEPYLNIKNSAGAIVRYQLPSPLNEGFQQLMGLSNPGWTQPLASAWLEYNLHKAGAVYASGGTIAVH